ncbi:hypothetical protein AMATHDRAFT_153566 [Amanita thiersii Skay4041]|uniref:mRNA decay factor PAT1 domain-containing protein n=1 Tax=Amanita thiersii Skay4041 TaxID=703135 RepID=A0A2A9NC23_9AGAR|nr:hypothetical protein AMATHDRAFT_153566 [Amanita thiersii Skay4041]
MSAIDLQERDIEKMKQSFLLRSSAGPVEDVPVFTWGEESYDGLGDALQEGGDELNDETFGIMEAVGKDFDFSSNILPNFDRPLNEKSASSAVQKHTLQEVTSREGPLNPVAEGSLPSFAPSNYQVNDSIWDNKSAFSVLPRVNGGPGHIPEPQTSLAASHVDSSFLNLQSPSYLEPSGSSRMGVRTVEEIEAEMRTAAEQSRVRQQERILQQQMQQEHEERQRLSQERELQRQRLYQLEQQQLQQHQLHLQRLAQYQQYQRTPPPRMLPPSQSPRFLDQQRQLLLLQQQRVRELQEQLQLEEMERQLLARASMQQQHHQSPVPAGLNDRQPSGSSLGDTYVVHQQRQQSSQSPTNGSQRYSTAIQDGLVYHNSQNIQLQQRLLSELAQAEFIRNLQGTIAQPDQEALRVEAMRKILEAEKMEEKRRRKAAKIAHMSRYNDLMTQSDKDFITRIQVSQLVTQDPYADDFYAQVFGAILRSKLGLQSPDERVLKFGSGGGIGLGLGAPKGAIRRPSAMQRMEQQVERIVNNARRREEEKDHHALQSLQGALGKTSGRSYKAAPRQLLQVDTGTGTSPTVSPAHAHTSKESTEKGAEEAAKLGRETLGNAVDTANLIRREPLSQRETLAILENLYDLVLHVEQLHRDQTSVEEHQVTNWKEYEEIVNQLWDGLRVMIPLETSDPHPFVSLLIPTKGKKLLLRLTRHVSNQRMLTLLTLLVACFSQLDVVKQAHLLDSVEDTKERMETERQTQVFLGSVLQSILPIVAKAKLRLVTGLLSLLLDRSNIVQVAQTRPGLALLTLFLSRVEVIKQNIGTATDVPELPSPEEAQQWQLMFDHLFQLLAPHLLLLFPSTRITSPRPLGHSLPTDMVDQPVWQFFAAVALHAASEQQHVLVTALRDKVLDNVLSVNKGWITDEEERQTKLANVNLFLHALGLDSSQIVM